MPLPAPVMATIRPANRDFSELIAFI